MLPSRKLVVLILGMYYSSFKYKAAFVKQNSTYLNKCNHQNKY